MISTGTVRKRTGLSRHFPTDKTSTKPTPKQQYDPTLHFWLLGVICFIIVMIMLITLFYAPKRPKHSKLSQVFDAYLSDTEIYEINFDAPPEFIQHIISNPNEQNLQQSINKFYGDTHSTIIVNDGWELLVEGANLNKPGLVCKDVGCLISIKLVNVMDKIESNTSNLHATLSYLISNEENTMGIAKIWIDTNGKVNLNRHDHSGQTLDAFNKNTKAVTKLVDWRVSTNNFVANDELYFHAIVIADEYGSRHFNKFKILGFALYLT